MIPKFRVWDKRSNEMWKVSTLHIEDEYVDLFKKNIYENPLNDPSAKFGDVILMQSTGLKDKNGVEIFEGDICIQRGEEPYSDENMTLDDDWEYTGIIKFQDFAYWLQDNEGFSKWLGTDCDEIEVIGNVWDNPELLEGTE